MLLFLGMRMETIIFIIAIIFIYASDFFFFAWISCRFVAAEKVTISQIIVITISTSIFMFLFLSALVQVPLTIKPMILAIAFVVVIVIFVHILQSPPAKAALAGIFFIIFQILLTIFLLNFFWNNKFVQVLKYIFLQSLY